MNRKLVASSLVTLGALGAAAGVSLSSHRPAPVLVLPAPDTAAETVPALGHGASPAPQATRRPAIDLDTVDVPIPKEKKGDFIADVEVSPPDPCVGDTVMVTIHPNAAAEAERGMEYSVKGKRGNPVAVPVLHPGLNRIVARVKSPQGMMDGRWVRIEAKECPDHEALDIQTHLADDRRTYRFFARSATERTPDRAARYNWDFGDGARAETDRPYAEHRYAVKLGQRPTTSFDVEVVASVGGTERARGRAGAHIGDLSFANRARFGLVAPEISAGPVEKTKNGVTAHVHIENPAEMPLSLDTAVVERVPCEGRTAKAPLTLPASQVLAETRVGSGATLETQLTLSQDAVPKGTCRVVVKFEGTAPGARSARGTVGLLIERTASRRVDATQPEGQRLQRELDRAFAVLGRDRTKERVTEKELATLRGMGLLGEGSMGTK